MANWDFVMIYIPNTKNDQQSMLKAIGRGSIDELFADITEKARLKKDGPLAYYPLWLLIPILDFNMGY